MLQTFFENAKRVQLTVIISIKKLIQFINSI
jgi:hypothetical protein